MAKATKVKPCKDCEERRFNNKGMTATANANRDEIARIRRGMLLGEFTHDEARAMAKPIIEAMNKRAMELAKENGMRFRPLTFINLMR